MNSRLQKLDRLCRDFRATVLYVFGSRSGEILRALEDPTLDIRPSTSDVDIGALVHTQLSVDEKVRFALELEELFRVPKVDLVVLQEADAFLAANIIRGERIFAVDSHLADEYELFVLRRAGDLAGIERERMSMILGEE